MSKIAFGTFRLSIENYEHYNALKLALEKGCEVIDTSSSYMDGKSEKLIGKVLEENPQFNPTIITKGGILNLREKDNFEKGRAKKIDVLKTKKNMFYSLDEDVIDYQINKSLEHLKKKNLDVFLLHNPETYFLKKGNDKGYIYKKISDAFKFLEKMVKKNKIKTYGVSSNSFSLNPEHPSYIDLYKLIDLANSNGSDNNFRWIEFPLNLMERGAMEQFGGNPSLIEKAKKNNIKTLINRPLNAFDQGHLTRLATYEKFCKPINYDESQRKLEECIHLMEEMVSTPNDSISNEDLWTFTNLRAHWVNLHTVEQVDNIFNKTIYPILNKGSKKEHVKRDLKILDDLYSLGIGQVRQYMTKKANRFRKVAINQGLIPDLPEADLAVLACETYSKWDVDLIALGMKRTHYVDQLSHLF